MEASPLTQQTRPETFKPKIVQLYETLFQVGFCCVNSPWLINGQASEDADPSEGFWREFFLLPPDSGKLGSILNGLTPDETLSLQVRRIAMLGSQLADTIRRKPSVSLLGQSERLARGTVPRTLLPWT